MAFERNVKLYGNNGVSIGPFPLNSEETARLIEDFYHNRICGITSVSGQETYIKTEAFHTLQVDP